jgi:hypothetical protein
MLIDLLIGMRRKNRINVSGMPMSFDGIALDHDL